MISMRIVTNKTPLLAVHTSPPRYFIIDVFISYSPPDNYSVPQLTEIFPNYYSARLYCATPFMTDYYGTLQFSKQNINTAGVVLNTATKQPNNELKAT